MNNVIVSISEEELIVSLYNDYLVKRLKRRMINSNQEDTKISVKAFSDYILQYLIARYNLDEEDTDA